MKKTINLLFGCAITGALVVLGSCSDDDKKSLPKIDGFNNSNEVAVENLVAHWNFDDNRTEVISDTEPSNTYGTVGYEDGRIGKALKLTAGAVKYPSIAAIGAANSLPNFTVSLWVKVKNNKKTANPGATVLFALLHEDDTDIWGNINMLAETAAHLPASDTLLLKPLLKGTEGGLQDNISTENGDIGAHFLGAQDWVHYVARWNGVTHMFEIFANGDNVGGYNERGTTPQLTMRTPVHAVFGSLTYSDLGFEEAPARGIAMATATIDDVRVFNTNLTDAQIGSLYKLGNAGR